MGLIADGLVEMSGASDESEAVRAAALTIAAFLVSNTSLKDP